ncbi:MAG: hypothetical protein Q3965_00820 [Rothia sp. (in: high G+C Gram-positive bacteria)]|nr:hypothetical protein [Rothia sp. (in: high G+C Gram-positive bacteria)]
MSVTQELIEPAAKLALANAVISAQEMEALLLAVHLGEAKAGDFAQILPGSSASRSQKLSRMVERNILRKVPGERKYSPNLMGSPISIYVVR